MAETHSITSNARFAVSLYGQPETRPFACRLVACERFDHVQGKIEPVGLLGVDGELHAEPGRAARQVGYPAAPSGR